MLLYRTDHVNKSRRLIGTYTNVAHIAGDMLEMAFREVESLPNNGFKVIPAVVDVSVVLSGTHSSYDLVFQGTDSGDVWKHFIKVARSGVRTEIDGAMFERWLSVLPPATMGKTHNMKAGGTQQTHFGFAEGAEDVLGFWLEGHFGADPAGWWEFDKNRYFCQMTADHNPRPFG